MSDDRPRTFKETARLWYEALNGPLGFVMLVIGFAVAYFSVIEWRVNSIVSDPDYLAELARRARPALVFDSDGRVLADMGALELLEGVPEVELASIDEDGPRQTTITVRPKSYLATEPIIESLDGGYVSVEAQRTKGTSWVLVISARANLVTAGEEPAPTPFRYRLEIVPR